MKIIWLDTIDSTNSEALRRLAELPSMTVLAAREQTWLPGNRPPAGDSGAIPGSRSPVKTSLSVL